MRAIRGANTIRENTAEEIRRCTLELLQQIMERNQLTATDFISVIFSATRDVDAAYPAKYARELDGWDAVPLFCVQEMEVQGSLRMCIRALCLVEQEKTTEPEHIYLGQAQSLRPDLLKKE